jgi:hypothetical protein
MAGFAGRPQPGGRTVIPAAFKYALAVSRRTPVVLSICRSDQPSRPRTITCSRFVSLKTLAILASGPQSAAPAQRLSRRPMAGFQVSTYGRLWVSTEA